MMQFLTHPEAAPAIPGAYVLWLRLGRACALGYAGREALFAPGDYLYCGSALGPGGLRARLSRHFRYEKRPHWHIDRLTAVAPAIGAFIDTGRDECALNAALAAFAVAAPKFGSSDCRRCASHLRYWPQGAALPAAFRNALARSGAAVGR